MKKLATVFFLLLPLVLFASQGAMSKGDKKPRTFADKVNSHKQSVQPVNGMALERIAANFTSFQNAFTLRALHPELARYNNLSVRQVRVYDELKKRYPDMRVVWSEVAGTPIFIEGNALTRRNGYLSGAPSLIDARNQASTFLSEFAGLLAIDDPDQEFRLVNFQVDERGRTHIRLQQVYAGIDVWGCDVYVHLDPYGNVDLFNGRYIPTPHRVDFTPISIEARTAVATAINDLQAVTTIQTFSPEIENLLNYSGPTAQRIIWHDRRTATPHTAYVVEIRPSIIEYWRYFIDAETGDILEKYDASCSDGPEKAQATDLNGVTRTVDTYLYQGTYFMIDATRPMFDAQKSVFPTKTVGTIVTIDARNTDMKSLYVVNSNNNTWTDKSTVSAHYNAVTTYEYFRTTFNRNSIDDKGMAIQSVVHVTSNNQPMNNAFWNGQFMAYGDGKTWKPLAGGLDIGAHEMTHGVTGFTAGLEYVFQSGALNESISDIFGAMVDRDDWQMGEGIVPVSSFPSGALRDMADPHNGVTDKNHPAWQPSHMNEFMKLDVNYDNGGVHINSGIPNHCAYLLAQAIGRDKTERIVYCALTTKLTRQSQFIDFRLALIRCAEELYGKGSTEAKACATACDQVGITDGNPTDTGGKLPEVNGPDFMLATSSDPNDPYYLYVVKPPASSQSDFRPLTQTSVRAQPSVSDNGTFALFVDGKKNIRIISLDPQQPGEMILDNSGIWNNIALSRDQNLIAATTVNKDRSIYVFDVSGSTARGKQFEIYTPSYSGTPVPNTVVLADALDFNFDNSVLLFDCYNEVDYGGDKYGFWEMNILRAWDPQKNDFGSGLVERIFPSNPEMSIGNPSFARNHTTVFCFDIQIESEQYSGVYAMDALTGNISEVSEITYPSIGYPSYRSDDKVVSFGDFPMVGQYAGNDIIINAEVGNDAITPTGNAGVYIVGGVYPVWYRVGQRPTGTTRNAGPESFTLEVNYPNPFGPGSSSGTNTTSIRFSVPDGRQQVLLQVRDHLGRIVQTLVNGPLNQGSHTVTFQPDDIPPGVYFAILKSGVESKVIRMMYLR